ncbi:MAG: acyltransferase [Lacunisphaera sp.]|nr:acyltransferase [Lacunisphaera sp.]
MMAPWLPTALQTNGGLGVTLFFVISGYLITLTSLRRYGVLEKIRIREFWSYRLSRIFPALVLLAGLNLLGAALLQPGFVLPASIPAPRLLNYVFTFRFNLLYLDGGAALLAWAPLWSLAIEEVFYLGFPLLARALRTPVQLVFLLGLLIIAGPLYRQHYGWGSLYLYWGCFDQLSIGCLIALSCHHLRWKPWFLPRRAYFQAGGLLIVASVYFLCDIHHDRNWVWMPTAAAAGAGIFLFGSSMAAEGPAAGLGSRTRFWLLPLAAAGILSYELYLFHLPLLLVLKAPLHRLAGNLNLNLHKDLTFLIVFGLMLGLAGLLHLAFSVPAQRGLRRLLQPLT